MTDRLPYTPASLGFAGDESSGWTRTCRGVPVHFVILRTLDALQPCERLQLDVFGVTERDLIPANELIVVSETGGEVFGAFVPTPAGPHMAATLIGWGGFVSGKGRIVSDFLAVETPYRNLGLGADLKRLQAAVALSRGFHDIVWTVDPLRAPNARLNLEKLGATCHHYERNRYGAEFGAGLYGGMPTDRLHMTWTIGSGHVRDRLLTGAGMTDPALAASLPPWRPGLAASRAVLALPSDIDALLADSPEQASAWRMSLREALETAFAEGWTITGFIPNTDPERGISSYLLERLAHKEHP
ncbi:MAG: hypothetical protein ACR2J8_11315 [Thermomicrobiales bacterium]